MTVLIHLRSNQGLFLFEALPGDPLLVTLLQSDAWTHISCVELMPTMTDTPITLHNLHADIVKRIIHGAESLDNLQVVSIFLHFLHAGSRIRNTHLSLPLS